MIKHSSFGIVCFIVPLWVKCRPANPALYRTPPLAATKIKAEFITVRLAATLSLSGAGNLFVQGSYAARLCE
ncbi:MAG: hypothetical protein H6642_18625 [Caldilineaceae bacterium]|nr:hypothetical protein [Caldilineaceae bacterium]